MFFKISVLKNFAIFEGKYMCWSLFLIKVQAFKLAKLLIKRLQRRCFYVYIAKFFKKALITARGCFFCFYVVLYKYGKLFLHWIFLRFTSADSYLHVFSTKLTHSFPLHPFSTPFSGCRERVHWERMG